MSSLVAGPSNHIQTDIEDVLQKNSDSISSELLQNRTISSGHTVLFRLPSGDTRSLVIKANQELNFGKFGKFDTNSLIGQPFGLSYEIVDKELRVIPPKPLQDLEETEATNELIYDGQSVQPLSSEEIEQLKKQNTPATAIIQAQIENHVNYHLKTEYSKDKYRKRKEAKFSKSFSTLEPTLYNVNEYWFSKDPSKIRELRSDALAQMLSHGNVHTDGRYLVVDDGAGILVTAVLERLAGKGRLIVINNTESPPTHFVLDNMNFSKNQLKVMTTMNWAYTDPNWNVEYHTDDESERKNEKQKVRLEKRKRLVEDLSQLRAEFFAGDWDGLLISSEYEPYSIIELLEPLLAGSANIVVHHPNIQVLAGVQTKLRQCPQYLSPNITEIWTRRYQVLPGRFHPLMTMSGNAGYLLHTIKVFNNPMANAVENERKLARLAKKRKIMSGGTISVS
ncbi:hypothetical protein Clacol_007344 [Clathrus columnatus]|uniref:tRNA (adenine(58)-N(1))-methyltransferase non-catalytic subunit TRM6 n=1 Tax=Clathrus columnatus TaxID=1419009 RepID=A0AAV5AEN2_9AGAM|nr:hypothetical protein Clacol_007344 [Clathrus columnatus]